MKLMNLNLLIATALLLGTIFTGCQSAAQREAAVRNTVLEANQDLQDWQKDMDEETLRASNAAKWKRFKKDSEITIKNNEYRIKDLRIKLKKPGTALDPHFLNKIEKLEQQNKDLKRRIKDYREDQGDWESFKHDFNQDMDELGKALKDLMVVNIG